MRLNDHSWRLQIALKVAKFGDVRMVLLELAPVHPEMVAVGFLRFTGFSAGLEGSRGSSRQRRAERAVAPRS